MAKKKAYRIWVYWLCRAAAAAVGIMPRRLALGLARAAGRLGYLVISRQRNKAFENLRFAYSGRKTEPEIRRVAARVFENLAMTAAEVIRFPSWSAKNVEERIEAGDVFETVRTLLSEGHGLIMMSGHFGNWELLAGIFGLKGFKGAVIGRRLYYEPYNRWIVSLRRSVGVGTLYRDEATRDLLKALGANQIVGIVPDQDIDSLRGIFVDFFGRPAYTAVAPARLSLASGAPILPAFLIHRPGGRYEVVQGKVIRPRRDVAREQAVVDMTAEWMRQFEKVIEQYPEQWAWMHNRWKTQVPLSERKEAVAL